DYKVTGVQTCALPILLAKRHRLAPQQVAEETGQRRRRATGGAARMSRAAGAVAGLRRPTEDAGENVVQRRAEASGAGAGTGATKIGRASCRERGRVSL